MEKKYANCHVMLDRWIIISGHPKDWALTIEFTSDLDFRYSVWNLTDSDLDIQCDNYHDCDLDIQNNDLDLRMTFTWKWPRYLCDINLVYLYSL